MDVMDLFKQACELPEQDRAELAALLLDGERPLGSYG